MSVISTIKTDCKDCYKCVRICPMKAIRISDGSAQIVEERCINDGTCIHVCPQQAKQVRTKDIDLVREWLKAGENIAVSLAPSYAVAFDLPDHYEIVPILRKLGFSYIQETALAAEYVAQEHIALLNCDQSLPLITSCCPVIVDLVEIHYPELIPYLAPVLSPMALHGKMLKQQFNRVVFIGPCIAKKEEMEQAEIKGQIDAAITFQELQQLIDETDGLAETSDLKAEFDGDQADVAKLFPLGGGLLKTAALSTDILADEFLTVVGLEEVIQVLEDFESCKELKMLELLACKGGCLGGVGAATSKNLIQRRQELLMKQQEVKERQTLPALELSLKRNFVTRKGDYLIPTEEEIRDILSQIGKSSPEDELNCGSCGYNSCQEKAIAVYNGLAELEMCLPYMRSRAESMSNLIMRSTPNGFIVTNKNLEVIEINPAAERLFNRSHQQVKGQPLAKVMDDTLFKKVAEEKVLRHDLVKYSDSLIVKQYIFYEEEQDLIVGIFSNVTTEEQQRQELDEMREETLQKAQDVIDKQMRVAQEIAGLLGETTAETKVTLTKLMKLMDKK